MARVSNWSVSRYDGEFINASMDRLRKAAEVIADAARSRVPVGTYSRPIYRRGPYAGCEWTKRDAGALKRTIRVVEKRQQGAEMAIIGKQRNVRVYAGNWLVYYAQIVEYAGRQFLRPALNSSKEKIRQILENG